MFEFLKIVLGGLVAAMLSPYFSYFLSIKKTKREVTLKYLEEAYELTKRFDNHIAQIPAFTMFSIAFIERKMNKNDFPKFVESPVSRLVSILDYHLAASPDLIKRIENLNIEGLATSRPIAESINEPGKKSQLFTNAVSLALDVAEKGPVLSSEIIHWIKEEKRQIESELTPFQWRYWEMMLVNIGGKCRNLYSNFKNIRTKNVG
ncbi:MAG: hypothetical protein Q8R79_01715 [Legionellaceae bacterium]|nr:hypothetical protein [Legionellaceae bacterium]